MNRKSVGTFLIFAVIFLTGCVTTSDAGYYWGSYSKTYYALLKSPNEETLRAHHATLEDIIEKSRQRDLQIPPGVQAELGYLLAKQENNKQAMALYQKELKLYPESSVFLKRLLD